MTSSDKQSWLSRLALNRSSKPACPSSSSSGLKVVDAPVTGTSSICTGNVSWFWDIPTPGISNVRESTWSSTGSKS